MAWTRGTDKLGLDSGDKAVSWRFCSSGCFLRFCRFLLLFAQHDWLFLLFLKMVEELLNLTRSRSRIVIGCIRLSGRELTVHATNQACLKLLSSQCTRAYVLCTHLDSPFLERLSVSVLSSLPLAQRLEKVEKRLVTLRVIILFFRSSRALPLSVAFLLFSGSMLMSSLT